MAKKDEKTSTKEVKKTKNIKKKTKTTKVKGETYFEGVASELKKVKWPSKKEVLKYTFSTIMFVLVLVGFFILMSLVMSIIRGAFN